MPQEPASTKLTEPEWLDKLRERRSEIAVPGYWEAVAKNCEHWADELSVGPFWSEVKKRIDQWRSEYKQQTDADLLTQPGLPNFCAKSADSIKKKLLRRCRC